MTRWEALVTVVVAALGGGTVAKVIDSMTGRRKVRADATSVIVQAATGAIGVQEDVIERLQQQTQALVLEADNLRREVASLRSENANLHTEITALKRLVAELHSALSQLPHRGG